MLREYLELAPRSTRAVDVRRLIENPRRAREPYAPDFEIVTMDGQRITLESLRGKTVLLDFWGTWCPPCRAATPDLVRLATKHAERPFVIVGVSSDESEKVVQDYVQKHRMSWPQFVDLRRQGTPRFQGDGLPHLRDHRRRGDRPRQTLRLQQRHGEVAGPRSRAMAERPREGQIGGHRRIPCGVRSRHFFWRSR